MHGPRVQQRKLQWYENPLGATPCRFESGPRHHASSHRVGLVHPGKDVAVTVQDAPDIDVIAALYVEDDVRMLLQRPVTQAR